MESSSKMPKSFDFLNYSQDEEIVKQIQNRKCNPFNLLPFSVERSNNDVGKIVKVEQVPFQARTEFRHY
jgi:hypothetical protein